MPATWLHSLTVAPMPDGPAWTTFLPIASRTGRTASKSAGSPPTMIESVPCCAAMSEPETGASRQPTPRSRPAAATLRETAGAIVDMST